MGINKPLNSGFTLVELLTVISIISLLVVGTIVGSIRIYQQARVAQARTEARELVEAIVQYHTDVGFYPPEVNRGMDPGLTTMLPTNPDTGNTLSLSSGQTAHMPANWQTVLQQKWNGPYIQRFPSETPWKGEYDYNYWSVQPTDRNGCNVNAGVYIGVQPTSGFGGSTVIPPTGEQALVNTGIDNDGCVNGEIELLIQSL